MMYILYGQDDFSLRQALEEIKKGLGAAEFLAANTTVLDGHQVTLSQLLNLCNSTPFLAEKRLVIIENLLNRFEPKPGAKRRDRQTTLESKAKEIEEWQTLSSYIKQMPATTVLVLIDGELSRDNPLLQALSQVARVITFPLLRGKLLRDWISKRVAEDGSTISFQAVNLLAEVVGGDLWAMDKEIEKLILYCSERTITEDDVQQLVSHAREPNIFSLVDAILEARAHTAHQLLHHLFKEGVPPSYLLVRITRQLSLIVRAKELEQGLSLVEAKKRLELASDYSLDKILNQAKVHTLERLKEMYHKLVETDLAIKTGKYDGELALDLLIAELCQLSKAPYQR